MVLNKLVLLFSFTSVILSGSTLADDDCKVQPNFRLMRTCCRLPNPNMQNFLECEKFVHPINKQTFACTSSCVFNSTGTIDQDNKLNATNLRVALARMFPVNATFFDTVPIPAFKECELEMKDYHFRNITERMNYGSTCPTLPLVYFLCAGDKIFKNCPSDFWTPSKECETLKDYIVNCGKYFKSRDKLVA